MASFRRNDLHTVGRGLMDTTWLWRQSSPMECRKQRRLEALAAAQDRPNSTDPDTDLAISGTSDGVYDPTVELEQQCLDVGTSNVCVCVCVCACVCERRSCIHVVWYERVCSCIRVVCV